VVLGFFFLALPFVAGVYYLVLPSIWIWVEL
jgi:hypothetical protein